MDVLVAIAQQQAASKNAAAARISVNEALVLTANEPPGLPRPNAQLRAAELLHGLGADGESRSLLAALEEQNARVLRAENPAAAPLNGGRDAAAERRNIAQTQSETGDLSASLKTLRLLPLSAAREVATR